MSASVDYGVPHNGRMCPGFFAILDQRIDYASARPYQSLTVGTARRTRTPEPLAGALIHPESHTARAMPRLLPILTGGAVAGAVLAVAGVVVLRGAHDDAPDPRTDIALACHQAAPERQLRIEAGDAEVPPRLRRELEAAGEEVHGHWRAWLGVEILDRAPATLHFMDDAAAFAALYEGPRAEDSTATGFYRIRSHEAFILYPSGLRARARATAMHELSHLNTAWHLGPTPAWLNEGLAEYFETLRPGPPAVFLRSPTHLALLLNEGPVPLESLLALPRRDFATQAAQRRYASAWALIAFLQDHRAGREVLARVLREAYARRCEPRSRTAFDGLHSYPGGLTGLEAAWKNWIRRHSVRRRG